MRPVRRETLPVLIAEEIRRDIIHGVLKPNDKLPTENELSKILGVGRPTIREALRILEGQGWLEFTFGEGTYVMDKEKVTQNLSLYLRREEVLELINYEIIQLEEEGGEITQETRKKYEDLKAGNFTNEIEDFIESLKNSKKRSSFPYIEPSEIKEIKLQTVNKEFFCETTLEEDLFKERLQGAWLGRCVGCLIGKPVEGWSRKQIEKFLKITNSYPLNDYFLYEPLKIEGDEQPFHPSANESTMGNINFMSRDDDLDYTILNLKLIEENGFNFTTEDVAEEWLTHLPFNMVYTAERQAYSNLVQGLKPPTTATHRNPFREWIGAQIRADIFGYIAPGDPEKAAFLAYKDARLSHTKNGIYGAMFIAAAISASFVSNDLNTVIKAGLSVIPKKSRFAEVIENVIDWSKKLNNWEEVWEKVNEKYGNYNWVHVLPNIAYVLVGLIWGENNFEKTVSIAVMCGGDTDCNGATAGSLFGALKGKTSIPDKMVKPLNNRIKSAVFGYSDGKISDLIEKTYLLSTHCKEFEKKR